jgi:hypothetical protein
MTLYQYILLDDVEQANTLWEHGVMIAERREAAIRYLLYQIDKFYVEVRYNTIQNQIHSLTPFESTNRLAPYLELMDIGDL